MQIIPVEQVGGNFYGGQAFRASWSFGGESEPSKLTVDVVNENGSYSTPNLNFRSIDTVNLGGFNFQGYLVGYSLNGTAEQKTLTLEYADVSVLLDQYWVGLNKIHGEDGNSLPNIILVGKEYHPCDINMDSTVDYEEENVRLIDPCDPCPFSPPDKYKEACDPRNNMINNFEVYYTFSDLIAKIKSNIPNLNIDFDGSGYYMYKAQHIGNLRSVLSSWCSDLGLSFFWDPTQSKFILRSRTAFSTNPSETYDSISNNPRATEISFGRNILGTFSQGFVGKFERDGGLQDFPCQQDTWKMLRPVTLEDLFLPEPDPVASKYSGELSPRAISVVLSYYSHILRDTFLWFMYYGIKDATDAESYIEGEDNNNNDDDDGSDSGDDTTDNGGESPTGGGRTSVSSSSGGGGSGNGNSYQATVESYEGGNFDYIVDDCGSVDQFQSSGTGEGSASVLKYFGGMKIRKVYSVKSQDEQDKSWFYVFRDNMPEELQSIWKGGNSDDDPGYYFFVADSSEEAYSASVEADRQLAQNFLGKYYFNLFRTIITGGAGDDTTECSPRGPSEDGSGQWHKAKPGLENLEIFKLGYDPGSFLDQVKQDAIKRIEENEQTDEKRIAKASGDKAPEDFVANSYILLSRGAPKWHPELEFADKWMGDLYSWCGQQLPRKYETSDGRPEQLFVAFPEANWNQNIRLFIVKEVPQDLQLDIEKTSHKTEVTGGYKERIEEDIEGNSFLINEGPWGLLSTDCYSINFCGMQIFVPPGSFVNELDNYEDECVTAPSYTLLEEELYAPAPAPSPGPGYRVFVNCRSTFPRIKKKLRYNMGIDAESVSNVRTVNYVDYSLVEDNVAIFGTSCEPDEGKIENYLTDLGRTSVYNYSEPLFDISFKLAGVVPEIWSVEEGLSSINVEMSDNGVFTSYNLSSKIVAPPSISYIEQNFRNQKKPALGNRIGTLASVQAKTIRH